jgi:hypothetical protein
LPTAVPYILFVSSTDLEKASISEPATQLPTAVP